jgi:hypothetical protein
MTVFSRRRACLIGSTLVVASGVVLGSAPSAMADGPCGSSGVFAASGSGGTCTYTTQGEDTFSVPSGASTVSVQAIGAQGGDGNSVFGPEAGAMGGLGADVTGTVSVGGLSTLWVEVGAPGANGAGGGGGGSSDVRTQPMADGGLTGNPNTDVRLLVAGGGGGGGGGGTDPCSSAAVGGAGGSAGDGGIPGAGHGGADYANGPGDPGATGGVGAGGGQAATFNTSCGSGTNGGAGAGSA